LTSETSKNLLQEIRHTYENILQERNILDGKATNLITISGIIFPFLIGIQGLIFNNLITISFIIITGFFIILSIICSIWVFRISYYSFILPPNPFFKVEPFRQGYIEPEYKKENLDNYLIDVYLSMSEDQQAYLFISSYLICNGENGKNNKNKAEKLEFSQIFLLIGVILTILSLVLSYIIPRSLST
jgi:hypothetical protein